jgi:hypothetical protein
MASRAAVENSCIALNIYTEHFSVELARAIPQERTENPIQNQNQNKPQCDISILPALRHLNLALTILTCCSRWKCRISEI